ncbi:MAG: B12-binding domain-containing radical SAM protein [Desulfobacca sp. 4484_104]|nr:MAG: B12-binding domain-containing radical SAM protein [Desulfobacca sp. 4484_104]RLA89549.1 MAG: B12-binding domain-containing radical SAM protein [Deltaproteobacteria bacterium]
MRILLVQPTTFYPDKRILRSKTRWLLGLTIPYLAGLTPRHIQVDVVDDRLRPIPYDRPYDLVGITATCATADRGFQIAQEFRRRGVPVVMGGFHVSLHPEETMEHCDAVVVGEAESVWEQVLEDARLGRLQRRYQTEGFHDMVGLPRPRLELFDFRRYRVKIAPTQTSRGCPYHCSFCEVPIVYGHTYRRRPIGEVLEEIKAIVRITGLKKIYFIDDNLTGHREYAKDLFRGLMPLNVRWSCLWTINTSRDEELLDLAKKSGCYHVNIGIENVCPESIASIEKVQNPVADYEWMLKRLQERGIFYSLNFMFGLDGDQMTLFNETLEFLERIKAPMAFFNSVTPRRGTPMWDQLNQEGRIHNPDAEKYLGMICNFYPKHMSPEQCEAGVWRCFQKFYSFPSIWRRLFTPPNSYIFQGLPSNLYFHWAVNRRVDPVDFY